MKTACQFSVHNDPPRRIGVSNAPLVRRSLPYQWTLPAVLQDPAHAFESRENIADWNFHACRHTVATWLKTQGRSEYERALVLNHSESSVTAGYSHGHAGDLKRELLEQWAGHVAKIVQPEGITRLA